MRKFNTFTVLFISVLIFIQSFAYGKVQGRDGKYLETKKIKILKVTEPPQYYELDNKKYTLKSIEEHVKQLQEIESKKIILIWIIEIEKPESYESIEELVKVLKYFNDSIVSISPAGYEE